MKTNSPIGPKYSSPIAPKKAAAPTAKANQSEPAVPSESVDLRSGPKLEHTKVLDLSKKVLLGGRNISAGVGAVSLVGASAMIMAGTLGMAPLGMGALIGGVVGAAAGMALANPKLAKDFVKFQKQEASQRTRNADGRFRTKSGATKIDTLRETYGEAFAAGLPGNMPLQVMRAATGKSLTQMVKNPEHIDKAKEKLADWKAPELAPGGRTRNADGRIRQKRGDTKLDTLRKTYGMDFAAQLPGNMPLAVLRGVTGKSLSQMVETGMKPSP